MSTDKPAGRKRGRGKVVVVLAGSQDTAALRFVQRNANKGLCLMTPRDLSRAGWSYRVGEVEHSLAAMGDRVLGAGDIDGVLTCMTGVTVADLSHIKVEDRAYVAEETTAFLLAWLTALKCPILNRPTPQSLAGPGWSREKWVMTAAALGIPVVPSVRKTALAQEAIASPGEGATVTIVGRRQFGPGGAALRRAARLLAGAAAAELLTLRFSDLASDSRFVDASPHVDLDDDETAGAVLDFFERARLPRRTKSS